ncbi:MAG TPA: hypothetical protein VL354_11290 [Spirochaetia bacterium]|nr:hypothetical protein [Spirochaetia bacterium]
MKKLIFLACMVVGGVLACTSVKDSDAFLITTLDDASKSKALTDAGVAEYDTHLVRQSDFEKIAEIRNYFVVALTFDSTNARAQQYLSLIDGYKSAQLKKNLSFASRALKNPKRSDDDTYAMFVALRSAIRIDPSNADAKKMLNDTSSQRSLLINSYLTKAKAATDKIDDKAPDSVKEKQYGEAFQQSGMALDIDPRNAAAQAQHGTARTELAKLVGRRVDAAQKSIAAGTFTDARARVNALADLNRRVNNTFDSDVRQVTYSLNYEWALSLYNKKDYATAVVKNEAALAAMNTDEARTLRRMIADKSAQPVAAVSFDASLQDIDNLIAAGELVAAHKKVDSLAKVTKDPANMQQLDSRNDKILTSLKDVYAKGVTAYRNEDFKTAIDLLQTVVTIQVDYEQASDYLDKARSKQKLLEQF